MFRNKYKVNRVLCYFLFALKLTVDRIQSDALASQEPALSLILSLTADSRQPTAPVSRQPTAYDRWQKEDVKIF